LPDLSGVVLIFFRKEDLLRRLAGLLFCLLLIFLASSCVKSTFEIAENIEKDKVAGSQYEYEGDTVRYTSPEISVEATYLPPERLALYFSLFKDGRYNNPFPVRSYMVFSLAIENLGKKRITYNPKMTFLLGGKSDLIPPKGYTDIYMDFERAKADDLDLRAEAFKAACFDMTVTLEPGQKVQRLIVYPRTDKVKDSGSLLVDNVFVGDETQRAMLLFKQGLLLKEEAR